MRIEWLRIPNYRNLRNFEINFDESQPTTVLLGHNGSGKSNLLEAIVEIFRELEVGRATSFAYSIRYLCYNARIEVTADPAAARKLHITVDGKVTSLAEFERNKSDYLPLYVFGYYSGWNSRMERQFEVQTRDFYRRVRRNPGNDIPLRRFLFCRKDYSQLVLLAFFLSDHPAAKRILRDYLKIDQFETALFVLHRPDEEKNRKQRNSQDGDARFWNVGGAFRPLLDRLWDRALAPIRSTESVERDIRRTGEATERVYLFIKNHEKLTALRQPYESTKLFFFNLESLFLCDLIDEVRVKVRTTSGNLVTFSQLSEGEQQLLTVLGLLLFTQDDESLFLLDEPNTHLNPVWTYEYLELLKENIHSQNGQVIVATHDPLMIGSLYKNQVRVLTQESQGTLAAEPVDDPIGIGIEGLLKSELYGLPSTLAPQILEKLRRHYELLGKDPRTPFEQDELVSLVHELNELGVSRTHPNPYFELFANAMNKRMPRLEKALTKQEIDDQTKLADAVLDEILAEETASKGNPE